MTNAAVRDRPSRFCRTAIAGNTKRSAPHLYTSEILALLKNPHPAQHYLELRYEYQVSPDTHREALRLK
jgi:hypothetical protein